MPANPDQLLAEGFARHAAQWAAARGAARATTEALHRAATALSLAVSNGHVCIGLDELAGASNGAEDAARRLDTTQWRATLLASGIVGTPDAPGALPLILDADGRLYLHRYFDYERRLAMRLTQARTAPADPAAASPEIRGRLADLFAANSARLDGAADWQQLAAALALRGRLTVVSGGPGTGKTTTVVNLLACLVALDPHCRIALAAPTGKAAARMTDAIRQRAAHLPDAIRGLLPTESSTVHRLLGVSSSGPAFMHHAGNPLAIDALVVDEASMLDLALATHLLEAVPATARIILLGDKDQLAAVESGAVFAELSVDPTLTDACIRDLATMTGTPASKIVPPAPATASTLHDASVWFTQNYRFAHDSGIGRFARLVNAGEAASVSAWLREGSDPDVTWLDGEAPAADAAPGDSGALRQMEQGYATYIEAVDRDAADRAAITDAFGHFRVLCAVREGPRGVAAVNAGMTRRFRAALRLPGLDDGPGGSPWFVGRPVLILNNDYVLRLFNGDIGIALPDASGQLLVHFPDAEADGGFRAIAPVRLPRHETAFAMTIHKSQGSEFAGVLVMLPEQRSRVLTRELLYTAITRARSRVTLVAGAAVLEATVAASTARHSGLLTRLAEATAAARHG
jgi:exodeoxyribonuclease V alpha subunit